MVDHQHPSRSAHPSPRTEESSSNRPWFHASGRLLLFSGLSVILVMVIVAVIFSSRSPEAEVIVDNKVHTIQLDVLNGAGEAKLAQRVMDFLRARGFDVVEIGNYAGDLEKTIVIDRAGNREAAVRVANSIGVPEERVIQKIDRTLYLDVSVYIGQDYQSLHPFK